MLDLTQQEFANKIGSKRNTVATYEMGRSVPSAAVVTLICKTFNVNEEWLRTGSGEPFNATPETLADKLAQEYGLDDVGRRIMVGYLNLNEDDRLAVGRLIQNIMNETAAEPVDQHAIWEAEARAEAEEYYQEILEEKKRQARESAFFDFNSGDLLA